MACLLLLGLAGVGGDHLLGLPWLCCGDLLAGLASGCAASAVLLRLDRRDPGTLVAVARLA